MTVTDVAAGAVLRWRHPTWVGWPVRPDVRVGFAAALAPISGVCVLDYYTATGALLGSSSQGAVVHELPSAGTVFVQPTVRLFANPATVPVGGVGVDG